MNTHSDSSSKTKKVYSWEWVLFANLCFIASIWFLISGKNFSTSVIPGWSSTMGIMEVLIIVTGINFLLIFISLFFSKRYWYKWLIMALIGFSIIYTQLLGWIDFFSYFGAF
ncbi:hypothetical protein ACE193_22480 [Bernardetia sp. OM2101]|uniref:hypothetical protein n=1 Tax=Bernardetia sp. OM2101 TaxID=3344876 RepID=UPI0035CF6CA0